MALSYFLAQLLGSIITIFAAVALIRPAVVTDALRDFRQNQLLATLVGIIAVSVGVAMVLAHNIWTSDWRVVVTLIGWLALVKGVMLLLAPSNVSSLGRSVLLPKTGRLISLGLMFALGAYLAAVGFGF